MASVYAFVEKRSNLWVGLLNAAQGYYVHDPFIFFYNSRCFLYLFWFLFFLHQICALNTPPAQNVFFKAKAQLYCDDALCIHRLMCSTNIIKMDEVVCMQHL